MKKILKSLKRIYRSVLHSIAFYPVLISILFVLFALFALSAESWKAVQSIKVSLPYLFIEDYETARSILSIFIGGIISLTVFSFSMVMLVLSQASSNFSPRLLPGLISNSRHQIILGTYTGSLLYSIIVLISLGARGIDTDALGFSTMLAAVFTVVCIGLFVSFIHNISGAIQIHNIINRIFKKCKNHADKELKNHKNSTMELRYVDTSGWKVTNSPMTGYFGGFDQDLLHKSLTGKNIQIEIIPYQNQHLWEGMPILRTKGEITDKEMENLILCLNISTDRHEDDTGIAGMITLMEITVRAMSPGINDPGTAIDALTKLGRLVNTYLQYPEMISLPIGHGKCTLIRHYISPGELLRIVLQPIRLYCKHDSSVMFVLINALNFISEDRNLSRESRTAVDNERQSLRKDLEREIENEADLQKLLTLLGENVHSEQGAQ